MPDILFDIPSNFATGLPDLVPADSPDFAFHNDARQALRALNELAFADRGAPGLTVRSVVEDGAIADDSTDNLLAFQTTVNTLAAAGGGIALVPAAYPGIFRWFGTLTIPANVILRGLGDRSIVRGLPSSDPPRPAINFAPGIHRGGVENLVLVGDENLEDNQDEKDLPPIGIDLTGAQFLRLRNFQVWDFQVGVILSNGVTPYAGCNHLSDFEINRCHTGLRAWLHCNEASVLNGRIWLCRGVPPEDPNETEKESPGIALDIDSAAALTVSQVVIENFDLGVRVRGLTSVSLRDVYYESDPPNEPFPGHWMDIRPDKGSIVRMENSVANVGRSLVLGGSLEDAITNDEHSFPYFGAKRHYAAAPERNLLENGDFHRAQGNSIPGWTPNLNASIVENNADFVTGGRSYDITRTSNGNDGIKTSFIVPETTDYVTVMVRYKNISSTELLFGVFSGDKTAQYGDLLPPSADEWRVAAITVEVDPAAAGQVLVILTADQKTNGGQIRVDEVWAVVGATAAPPRAHAHRVEMLHEPVTVVTRAGLTQNTDFGPTDLTKLPGLGRAPRGIIGAILALRGTTTTILQPNPKNVGATMSRAIRPYIRRSATEQWSLDIVFEQLEHDRQVVLRSTSFFDGIRVFDNRSTSYRVDVVGWILPS